MKKLSFIQVAAGLMLMAIAVMVIGGDLNPSNTPSPTMRTLDEVYKNIQPGLPSDWKAFAQAQQVTGKSSIHLTLESNGSPVDGSCEVTSLSREDTIVVIGMGHGISTAYDAATGLPSGHSQHTPLILSKYIDKSSPRLYGALANNEDIAAVLRFYRILPDGTEQQYYTITLTGARIVDIKTAFPNIEQISLIYQSMEWKWEDGGISFTDQWVSSPS